MENKLEPEFQEPFTAWTTNQNPETSRTLLKAMSPAVDKAINSHVGKADPILRSHAKKIVLSSLPRYDPSQARLGTFVHNQLAGLKRIAGKQQAMLKVPERVAIDSNRLAAAELELEDELGRPPTDEEISDFTKFSPKRLHRIRTYSPGISTGRMVTDTGAPSEVGVGRSSQLWQAIVYDDLSAIDKLIYEHTTGANGKKVLANQALAKKLRLSPGAVSQRKSKIQRLLNDDRSTGYF